MFRYQLPAYSPLSLGRTIRALRMAGPASLPRLQSRLCERFDAREAVLCGSGTQALTLALRAAAPAGRQPLVALPAYACFDLVSAAVGADARLVFYDVEPETLSPELDSLAAACAEGPDAVVVVHLYGVPVRWTEVEQVVRTCDALLIEDAAQGIGGSYDGRPLGSLGDLAILSFGRGKGWTGGGGGAVLRRTERATLGEPEPQLGTALPAAIKVIGQWGLGRPSVYGIPASIPWLRLGETVYHPPVEPVAMHPFAAALVLENEEVSVEEGSVRRRNAREITAILDGVRRGGPILVQPPPASEPGYLRLPILLPRQMAPFPTGRHARLLGIVAGYPRVLPSLPEVAGRKHGEPPLSGSRHLVEFLVTVPTHSLLGPATRNELGRALMAFATES